MKSTDLMLNSDVMASLYKVAEMMASSVVTVPKHLQQSPGDCMAIAMQSMQWGMNPYAVAQKTHLVNGNLGYEAQLVNAVVSSSRAIKGRFHYEFQNWQGENGMVRVGAVLAGETDVTWGEWLDTKLVKTKNSPLWRTAPKQQAAYLAVKMWARLYCPEVILGVYTADEFEDAPASKPMRDITPQPEPKPTTAESLFANIPSQPEQTHEVVDTETGEVKEDPEATAMFNAEKWVQRIENAENMAELQTLFASAKFELAGTPWIQNVVQAKDDKKEQLSA